MEIFKYDNGDRLLIHITIFIDTGGTCHFRNNKNQFQLVSIGSFSNRLVINHDLVLIYDWVKLYRYQLTMG